MFQRFTEKAIKVIMLAQEEARRLGHNFVGTEQILLGLVGEGTGIAAKTLKSMGINLKDARVEVEKIIGRGSGFVAVEIPFTPRAKRVLEFAWDEARQFGHNYIGTEHLLLGLVREAEGVAARVLENMGVDLTKIRSHVTRLLGESGAAIGKIEKVQVDATKTGEAIFHAKFAKSSHATTEQLEGQRALGILASSVMAHRLLLESLQSNLEMEDPSVSITFIKNGKKETLTCSLVNIIDVLGPESKLGKKASNRFIDGVLALMVDVGSLINEHHAGVEAKLIPQVSTNG